MTQLESNLPLVSIIMTAYNEERYIKEAIDSILQQTFSNFELILINDGSTDRTDEIIKLFTDSRIKYICNKKNLRLITCLNIGLELARGKYIARMDSDDICYLDRLKKQVDFLECNPEIGILGSNLEVFGDTKGFMTYPEKDDDIRIYLLTTSSFGNNVVMIRKDILHKLKFQFNNEYLHAEDYKAWSEIIKHAKGYNFQEPLVKYRAHTSSVSNKYKHIQRETRNRIRAEYILNSLHIAENSVGYEMHKSNIITSVGIKRFLTYKFLIKTNKQNIVFNEKKFKEALCTNWYLDSLEAAEEKRLFVFFNYLYILLIDFRYYKIRKYFNLLKHYYKLN